MRKSRGTSSCTRTSSSTNVASNVTYGRVDKKIFDYCDEYNELPDVYDKSVKNAPKKRKLMDSASCADSESPVKRSFYVRDSSTDDE